MKSKKKAWVFFSLFTMILILNQTFCFRPSKGDEIEPAFTIVAKTIEGNLAEYLYDLKEDLAAIGIYVDVVIQTQSAFVYDVLTYHDFDVFYINFLTPQTDPDMRGAYDGSTNIYGYDTSMDYAESVGTGLNEWYVNQGVLINPPDSGERILHYWNWEQHLMDNILPCLPGFSPKEYSANWANLNGYDFSEGIIHSWGKISWAGTHAGQASTNEVIIADEPWIELNPLFQDEDDTASALITEARTDTLFYIDADKSVWPHLAEDYVYYNNTHIRFELREGVKWQTDPDGLFTNEYFDAKDAYFSFYCYKNIASNKNDYYFVDDFQIIDNNTFDVFLDENPYTSYKEVDASRFPKLCVPMLPEHYLNQTQEGDGVTPDIEHSSWEKYSDFGFGTGLFEISTYTEGVETQLTMEPDSWWLNTTITNDPNLDWDDRFGDFSSGIHTLTIKYVGDQTERISDFEDGLIDIVEITGYDEKREEYELNANYEIQYKLGPVFSVFVFNLRESRGVLGDKNPSEINPLITKGLAARKAIAYAINREEMNEEINNQTKEVVHWPIHKNLGIWCNPSIIQYDYNLETARDYMEIAGFSSDPIPETYTPNPTPTPTPTNTTTPLNSTTTTTNGISGFILLTTTIGITTVVGVVIYQRKRKNND